MPWDTKKVGTISEAISAGTAVFAVIVALGAAVVAWRNYKSSIAEEENKLSANAILEWDHRQPVNTRPCIELMLKFGPDDWAKVVARRELSLPTLREEVLACLSDQDEEPLKALFKDSSSTLTRKGTFLIANRLNEMLDADNLIAGFLLKKIGNPEMLKSIGDIICRDDRPIINGLPDIPRINASFASIREYIDPKRSDGCKATSQAPNATR